MSRRDTTPDENPAAGRVRSMPELATLLSGIEQSMTALVDRSEALSTLTHLAVEQIPGADFAGVTTLRGDSGFRSIAVTDDVVHTVDAIQYEQRSGPCVDAIVEHNVFCTGDLAADNRWPRFGRRAFEATGIVSMLAYRLFLEDESDVVAGLNLYSRTASAFDEDSEATGMVLATAGALAVGAAVARERAANLAVAMESRTEIGIAIGVLMAHLKTTREGAFDVLRLASQALHRKLADIASEVAETGALPQLPPPRGAGG